MSSSSEELDGLYSALTEALDRYEKEILALSSPDQKRERLLSLQVWLEARSERLDYRSYGLTMKSKARK